MGIFRSSLLLILGVSLIGCATQRQLGDEKADRDPLLNRVFVGSHLTESMDVRLEAEPAGTLRKFVDGAWQDQPPAADDKQVAWTVKLFDPHNGRRVPYADVFVVFRKADGTMQEMVTLEPIWTRGGFVYGANGSLLPDGAYTAEISVSSPTMYRDQQTAALWQTSINANVPFTLDDGLVVSDPQSRYEDVPSLGEEPTIEFQAAVGNTDVDGLGIELSLESAQEVRFLSGNTWASRLSDEGSMAVNVRLTDRVLQSDELPYATVRVVATTGAGGRTELNLNPTWSRDGLYYSAQAVIPEGDYEFAVEVTPDTFTRRVEYSDYFQQTATADFSYSYHLSPPVPDELVRTYWVAVGLYRVPENAQRIVDRLSTTQFTVQRDEWTFSGFPVSRLRVGPYDDRDSAASAKSELEELLGIPTMVLGACRQGDESYDVRYAVQIGAFGMAENVTRAEAKLADAGYATYTESHPSLNLTQVRVGPYHYSSQAREASVVLNELMGVKSVVVAFCRPSP